MNKYPDGNPKTVMGMRKLPVLSVCPPTAILGMCEALRYGAYEAQNRVTGTPGYGLYNWRDQHITSSTYIDAALRHLFAYQDGEDNAPDSKLHHIKHALAGLGILLDAIECGTVNDDRPKAGAAHRMIAGNVRETVQGPVAFMPGEREQFLNDAIDAKFDAIPALVARALQDDSDE